MAAAPVVLLADTMEVLGRVAAAPVPRAMVATVALAAAEADVLVALALGAGAMGVLGRVAEVSPRAVAVLEATAAAV